MPLDPAALSAKLVEGGRGGYCFEQNLLLQGGARRASATRSSRTSRASASGCAPGEIRGRTHLLLRVGDGERHWHADVGFGSGTLIEPIPWGPGEEHEQAGWRFRVVQDGGEWALQTAARTALGRPLRVRSRSRRR